MTLPLMPLDRDAMIWWAPEQGRAGRPLLVMMHGYGGVQQDLAHSFGLLPPDVDAVSVRAPVPLGERWSWGSLDSDGHAALDAAARGVLAWLDGLAACPSVGLLGFSQGGAMALQLLRHAPSRFAYAVQLSGFVLPGDNARDRALAEVRPPVFSGHGDLDDVIPVHDANRTSRWLHAHTTLVERRYRDLGHSVSDAMLRDVAAFVSAQLA